ncbi:putative sporulation protein YtxC [Mesobacillus harenae]|uniref:putative sporulation protein YtxC n=1 Tax=Mesobacillus harenae TaxID=2213203 RepID=UPI0015809E8B|nr:putative sporulation protein YtxC [Mesobacillus harenae]
MIEIIFQKSQDAQSLYDQLLDCFHNEQEKQTILLIEDRNKVKLNINTMSYESIKKVKQAFYEFIITTRREDWFKKILSDHYFYDDSDEQQQILEIIYSILDGNREELACFLKGLDDDALIFAAIEDLFSDNISFSFDSFVMFRLKSFIEKLGRYVELAIDEYKMEQEYQMFVQILRDFLDGREPQADHLHLVLEDGAVFFNADFTEIKRSELVRAIDRKLIVNHPVYIDSVTIAPLLSIAPSTIYLYTDEPDQPLIRTIKNIFEERVNKRKIKEFYARKNAHFQISHKN